MKNSLTLGIVALSAGSNFVFGAYAPQLANRLALSVVQINQVGTSMNAGVYLTGVPWGMLVDRYRPQRVLGATACCMVGGYLGEL